MFVLQEAITVILRSKNIFSSLESFQMLQLLNTHLVARFTIRRKKNLQKLNVFFLDQNRRNFTPQKLPIIRYINIFHNYEK
jgi:hypothetical protein